MLEQFIEFMKKHRHPPKGSNVLLAVSGGMDSMVMMHLFYLAGYRADVAHCNFCLRGDESDADEKFVEKISNRYDFGFISRKFEVIEYALRKACSIQLAARHLRYEWFSRLAAASGYDGVAVAHHADDVAETILQNITRGTGIAGLHGIAASNANIFRPLLFATRDEIAAYAKQEGITWREDSSNSEDYYTRNNIRHHVIPALKNLNPSFTQTMLRFSELMSGYERIIHQYVSDAAADVITGNDDTGLFSINVVKLNSYQSPEILLYHFLNSFGFTRSQVNDMLAGERTGATFTSGSYRMTRERDTLVLSEQISSEDIIYEVQADDAMVALPGGIINIENIKCSLGEIDKSELHDSDNAFIDEQLLRYPLTIRKRKRGDFFYPFGMNGKKLLSDYLIDEKFSTSEKDSLHLLLSGNEIVWVIGYRTDERFRITPSTTSIKKFRFNRTENGH